ncbi:MAG: TIGR00266 family protein [Bifidobacteriaceae bacterium]|nr:TIGR00266 family protein [Bifidobacteriaceae bacterium]
MIETNVQFPTARAYFVQGETALISRGSMIWRTAGVELNAKLNAAGSGLGKFVKAVARSTVSGESMFITEVVCQAPRGELALAPSVPGTIRQLDVGANQYRLNDSAFLAMDATVAYTVERQSIGKAMFGGQGGLFVMTTNGQGALLVNAFGSIQEIDLADCPGFTVDNRHVVAWDRNLDYRIELQGGFFGSIGTGEGVVNTFYGTGKVLIQSLNLETFVAALHPFLPSSSSS